jgi:winged helix DNA-binding protein
MPTVRVLSERELNRAVLARQLLLDRAPVTIPRALERVCGLQDQYAPSGYIGLWTRVAGFRRDDLTRALERKTVIQATLVRATIHLVSKRDFWPFAMAIDEPLRDWWFRATKRRDQERHLRAIDRRARALLASGPRRRKEIVTELGITPEDAAALGLWTPTVRIPPSGTWEQRRADLYGNAQDWIGPPTSTVAEGREHLIRRYLAAFGPATRADIASFTGLPRRIVEAVTGHLPLRAFATESGDPLLDVRGGALPPGDAPAPVRFLPTWDATLLVHARRTQILPERYRSQIFSTKTPQSVGTFLVDGQVAGTWRFEEGRVTTSSFEPLPRQLRGQVADEAAALAAFHA